MKRAGIAIATALAVVAGVIVAVDEQGTPKTDEAIELAVALKLVGVTDERAKDARGKERDPRTLRTDELVILVENPLAWAAWGEAYCEPLAAQPEHGRCLIANSGEQGTPMCDRDGKPAGRMARMAATPKQAERIRETVGRLATFDEPESLGWTPCPSE